MFGCHVTFEVFGVVVVGAGGIIHIHVWAR